MIREEPDSPSLLGLRDIVRYFEFYTEDEQLHFLLKSAFGPPPGAIPDPE